MQPVELSPPPRQGHQRTPTSEENGNSNSNKSKSNNNSNGDDDKTRQSHIDLTRLYSTEREDDGANGNRSFHLCPPHINGNGSHSGPLSSRHTNQQQQQQQQHQQQQQPKPKPKPLPSTSQSEPSFLSTTISDTTTFSVPAVAATKFSFFQLWGRSRPIPSSATPAPTRFVSPHTTLLPMRRAVSESIATQESPSASPDQIVSEVFSNSTIMAPLTSTLRRTLTPSVLVRSTLSPLSFSSSPATCSDNTSLVIDGDASYAEQSMRHMGMENTASPSSSSSSSSWSPTSISSSASSSSCFQSSATEILDRAQGYSADLMNSNEHSRNSSSSVSNGSFTSKNTTVSRQHESLAMVQERIVHGQDQLDYYSSLVLGLEKERDEAIQLLTRMKHERDVFANGIETLEKILALDPASVSRRGSTVTASRYQSLFSSTAGHIWTMSPPTLLRRNSSGGTGTYCGAAASCCSSDLPPPTWTARGTSPLVHSQSDNITTIAAQPMEATPHSSWTVGSSSTPSMPMCHRCRERASIADKRRRLSQMQGDVERVQQRVRFLESRMKHMGRTFIEPIMGCLANDREELARLRA